MGRLVFFAHVTVDGFIATENGELWDRFAWGDAEMAWNVELFRKADTWVFGRGSYEAIVPWWTDVAAGKAAPDGVSVSMVDREFAAVFRELAKVVLSTTFSGDRSVRVIGSELPSELRALKAATSKDLVLSCGPDLLAQLAEQPGVVDDYLVVVHPTSLSRGVQLFGQLRHPLAFELVESRAMPAGSVVLRYRDVRPGAERDLGT